MLKHTFYAIGLGLVVFFLYLLQYTGAFKSVTIDTDERGPYTVIFKSHVGAYHKNAGNIDSVEKWAKQNGLKCRLSFGEFFDDPAVVEEGRLNSRGGCLLDPLDDSEKTVFEKLKNSLPPDFKFDEIPKSKVVVALFSGAPGIGPLKVYPKAAEYIQDHRLTKKTNVIEIYEVFDSRTVQTTYLWPLL